MVGPTMKPYESPIERLRTMYRLPTAPLRNRVLEVCHGREPLLLDYSWPGESATVCALGGGHGLAQRDGLHQIDFDQLFPFAPEAFDLVVLHKTLDDLQCAAHRGDVRFAPSQFMARIGCLLAPGGVVAGCISNSLGMSRTLRRRRSRNSDVSAGDSFSFLTANGCRRLLQRCGFTDIKTYTVLPDWQSPLRLIDTEPGVSRMAFRMELEATRSCTSGFSYWVRRIVAELGLYPHLEDSIFFWGYKGC